jgi:hypothetical protein
MSDREEYFAVNDVPRGVATSFRVSGKLGELSRRFWDHYDAETDARRLNRAYRLGLKHGLALAKEAGK